MYKQLSCLLIIAFLACHSPETSKNAENTTAATPVSETRDTIKKDAVASYDVPLKNDLNKWRFTVKLHETKERYRYLLTMKYQEVTGSDTIRIPNFGQEPEPQIQKGANDLECIIGFPDKEKKFREYLKVFVEDDQLRVKTLKHYGVTQK